MRSGPSLPAFDPYQVLGVRSNATLSEIRDAYRRRARESHPDLHPHNPDSGWTMTRINLSARLLLDPALRAAYDRAMAARRSASAQAATRGDRSGDAAPSAQSWRERDSGQWVVRPVPGPPAVSARLRPFLRELRGGVARAAATVDGCFLLLRPRGRLLLGTLSMVLALLLLAAARPHPFVRWGGSSAAQPVAVPVHMLYP